MSESWEAVQLFREAFLGSLLVAFACSLVGVHVVARRLVVVGLALPQAAALGIAVSMVLEPLAAGSVILAAVLHHEVAAIGTVCLASGLLVLGSAGRTIGSGTLAGILFAAASAGTLLVLQRSAHGLAEVRHLVEGNVLALHGTELLHLAFVLVPVAALQVAGSRRTTFCTFDRDMAASVGVRTRAWEAVFFVSLAFTVAVGVRATGTLFVFAYLVAPPAAGILLARTAAGVFTVSAAVGVAAAAAGFLLSYVYDTPTGPTCAGAAVVALIVAAAVSRLRD